jgi:hypothetical protein
MSGSTENIWTASSDGDLERVKECLAAGNGVNDQVTSLQAGGAGVG